jgi:hypothetical protein
MSTACSVNACLTTLMLTLTVTLMLALLFALFFASNVCISGVRACADCRARAGAAPLPRPRRRRAQRRRRSPRGKVRRAGDPGPPASPQRLGAGACNTVRTPCLHAGMLSFLHLPLHLHRRRPHSCSCCACPPPPPLQLPPSCSPPPPLQPGGRGGAPAWGHPDASQVRRPPLWPPPPRPEGGSLRAHSMPLDCAAGDACTQTRDK